MLSKEQTELKDLHWWVDEYVPVTSINQKLHALIDAELARISNTTNTVRSDTNILIASEAMTADSVRESVK